MNAAFRSFAVHNYRIWFAGALVSNIGTWLQRTAQDWIVIHDLTANNAMAVGITMALQFGPQIICMPISGFAADHFDTRRLLMATQGAQALIAFGLGATVLTGHVTLPLVYLFALLLGIATAIDAPPRQTFVSQLVKPGLVGNAVSLNSASFNIARMIGPAVAGLLIAAIGAGWAFVINGVSFAAVLSSLIGIRSVDLSHPARAIREKGAIMRGFRYVIHRSDLLAVMAMILVAETFTFNFAVFISAMCTSVFHLEVAQFGLFNSAMAVGSVVGALLIAGRDRPRLGVIVIGCVALGLSTTLAAVMPSAWAFAVVLPLCGAAMQTMTASANGYVQLSSDDEMRGRVMAVYMAVLSGGTPIGAPVMGWIANVAGPRVSVLIGGTIALVAAGIGVSLLISRAGATYEHNVTLPGHRQMTIDIGGGRGRHWLTAGGPASMRATGSAPEDLSGPECTTSDGESARS